MMMDLIRVRRLNGEAQTDGYDRRHRERGWALAPLVILGLMMIGGRLEPLLADAPADLQVWMQTDWSGGPGQLAWREGDAAAYHNGDGVDGAVAGRLGLGYTLPYSSTGDLNRDGYADIVFANWMDQYPPQPHDVDSYVYWGGADGFSNDRRIGLPTLGAVGVSIADLNNDGFLDLVFSNQRGGRYERPVYTIDSYIYWGGPDGYTVDRRSSLPTLGSMSNAIADLDGNGYLDIVFANSTDGSTVSVDSYIYWGGPNGYSPDHRTGLPVNRAVGVSAVDLNQDGHLDLIFSNTTDGRDPQTDSYIYWGGPEGYSATRRTGLPTSAAYDNTAADLNGDGHLDLVFANRYWSIMGIPNFEADSYIYWGGPGGYSAEHRSQLPTVGAVGVSVADIDEDGHPDIVFSNGSSERAYIYWGSAAGTYGVEERSTVRAYQSLGNSIADLNGDGHLDLIFSTDWNGFIYCGSGSRSFSARRPTLVQTITSLSNAVAGAELGTAGASLGTVYTRPIAGDVTMDDSLRVPRIYADSGHLQSSAFDALGEARWLRLSWEAELPAGTSLALALSSSEDGISWSGWLGVADGSLAESGSVDLTAIIPPARHMRYRVWLTSSPAHRSTPWLHQISLEYELLHPTATPTCTATVVPSPTPSPTSTPTKPPTEPPTGTATSAAWAEVYLPLMARER